MNTIRTSTSLHFMLAVAVALVMSFSLATAASLTGLMPDAHVDPHQPPFWTPLTTHLHNAATIAAASGAQAAPAMPSDALAAMQAEIPELEIESGSLPAPR